jgi:hypothetical protein
MEYPYKNIPNHKGSGKRKGEDRDDDDDEDDPMGGPVGTDPKGPMLGGARIRTPSERRPALLQPRGGDKLRYDWAECFKDDKGINFWRNPRTGSVLPIDEDEIIPQDTMSIFLKRDRRKGGVVDHVVIPEREVPDMPLSWEAWEEFQDRMREVGMKPPRIVGTLKEMKVERDRQYWQLHTLEKEAYEQHEKRQAEIRAARKRQQPPEPAEARPGSDIRYTATEDKLWTEAYDSTQDLAEAKYRFQQACEGNAKRIEYERDQGIWAGKKPGPWTATTFMVEQLGKEEASKLIQSTASSSSGPSNLPKAGKPQVFEPSHPLGKDSMDWSEKSKRQAEQEEEQIKQLEKRN